MFNEQMEFSLQYKTFHFRQAWQFTALIGLMLCYFGRTYRVLHHHTFLEREYSSEWWDRIINVTWTFNNNNLQNNHNQLAFRHHLDAILQAKIKLNMEGF